MLVWVFPYPRARICGLLTTTYRCQFHDCLPGSSIEMCYRDSDKLYAELFQRCGELIEATGLALGIRSTPGPDTKPFAVNTLPWDRTELVKLPEEAAGACQKGADGSEYGFLGTEGLVQISEDSPKVTGEFPLFGSDGRADTEV